MKMAFCALKFKLTESLQKVFFISEMFLEEGNVCKTVLHLSKNVWWPCVEKPAKVLSGTANLFDHARNSALGQGQSAAFLSTVQV